MVARQPRIAIAIGDPAGIGPEIAIRAVGDPEVRQACSPVLVGDPQVLKLYAAQLGTEVPDAVVPAGILDPPGVVPGTSTAECGRATLDAAGRAIALAVAGEVEAVVACPHTQSSIASAGIPFDGYPSFVARETAVDADDVFLMLVSDRFRIGHVTLHTGIRAALDAIDRPRILRAIDAMNVALKRLGVASPRIAVSGVNPHAGEGGLFGSEELDTVGPAVEDACRRGIDAHGPFGADTMFLLQGFDAYLVMFHDQGHIPAKLAGSRAALATGLPILFSSVGHGSALDIAGEGRADPTALIWTLRLVSGV